MILHGLMTDLSSIALAQIISEAFGMPKISSRRAELTVSSFPSNTASVATNSDLQFLSENITLFEQ
jgi:hypothetical protein